MCSSDLLESESQPEEGLSLQKARKLARECIIPPATSARNIEAIAMSAAHFFCGMGLGQGSWETNWEAAIRIYERDPAIGVIGAKISHALRFAVHLFGDTGDEGGIAFNPVFGDFLREWRDSAYARLEVSHKLAASLCLTDVPAEIEVHAPWSAWSLIIPDGLLGSLARIWILSTSPCVALHHDGSAHLIGQAYEREVEIQQNELPGVEIPALRQLDDTTSSMLDALIKGSCLALRNPDEFKKQASRKGHRSSRRSGPPNLEQSKYMLSAPVKVDFREHVSETLRGGHRQGPKVQFLVRGHWRNQAYGPRRSLRKEKWIEPFWKGPEESRILLRSHQIQDDKEP